MNDAVKSIKLAAGLIASQQRALLKSITSPFALNSEERQHLWNGIDLLRSSRVVVDEQNLSFAKFFVLFIDGTYTEKFIDAVLTSKQIYKEYEHGAKNNRRHE